MKKRIKSIKKLSLTKHRITLLEGGQVQGGNTQSKACPTQAPCVSNLDTSPCTTVIVACESIQTCDQSPSFCLRCTSVAF